MKITIESHNTTLSADVPDDSTMNDIAVVLRGLFIGSGFTPETVDEYIKTEF